MPPWEGIHQLRCPLTPSSEKTIKPFPFLGFVPHIYGMCVHWENWHRGDLHVHFSRYTKQGSKHDLGENSALLTINAQHLFCFDEWVPVYINGVGVHSWYGSWADKEPFHIDLWNHNVPWAFPLSFFFFFCCTHDIVTVATPLSCRIGHTNLCVCDKTCQMCVCAFILALYFWWCLWLYGLGGVQTRDPPWVVSHHHPTFFIVCYMPPTLSHLVTGVGEWATQPYFLEFFVSSPVFHSSFAQTDTLY